MADESYGSVGTPRVFCDIVQFAKSIGMVENYEPYAISQTNDDFSSVWDFNPTKTTIFSPESDNKKYIGFYIKFKSWGSEMRYTQFGHLMSTINYMGMLGHNLGVSALNSSYLANYHVGFSSSKVDPNTNAGYNTWSGGDIDIIGGRGDVNRVGTSLAGQTTFYQSPPPEAYEKIRFVFACHEQVGTDAESGAALTEGRWLEQDMIKVGALTTGRYFDLPHSANLSLNQTISYDGVQSKRTIGGSDLTQVNYLRPKWGDYTPFQNIDLLESTDYQQTIDDNDFSTAGFQGRRSWDLSFSYISKEDMFPRSYSNNTAGYYDYDDTQEFDDGGNSTGLYTDNIVNNWLNLTLGGQIPFIFQPDKDKATDFAIVKMDKNSLQITQQAPMLYQFKVKLVEQF